MVIFLRIIILSFQSHHIRILNVGLGMAWNMYVLSCIASELFKQPMRQSALTELTRCLQMYYEKNLENNKKSKINQNPIVRRLQLMH